LPLHLLQRQGRANFRNGLEKQKGQVTSPALLKNNRVAI
jgi:hypothetical protein